MDWDTVYHIIHDNLTYHDIIREAKREAQRQMVQPPKKKRRWFGF